MTINSDLHKFLILSAFLFRLVFHSFDTNSRCEIEQRDNRTAVFQVESPRHVLAAAAAGEL